MRCSGPRADNRSRLPGTATGPAHALRPPRHPSRYWRSGMISAVDRWKREGLLSANNGLRNQVEQLLDAYERQQQRLAETYRQLEAMRVQAASPDRSVQVTVDSSGVLADLSLTNSALRKSPEELARCIVEAVQEAARHAREQQGALAAPVTAGLEDMADLSDLVPEAPGLRGIRAYLRGGDTPAD